MFDKNIIHHTEFKYGIIIGISLGLIASMQFKDIIEGILGLSILYSVCVFGFRCFICWAIHNSCDPMENKYAAQYARQNGLSMRSIIIEYNIWSNILNVRRDL